MKKIKQIDEPIGEHPYSVTFKYPEVVDGASYERKKVIYYAGTNKGQADLVGKIFMRQHFALHPTYVKVSYEG